MEYPKTVIIGVSYKDLPCTPPSQHFFAEVVLIEKTQEALQPLLYQLKKEALYGKNDLESIPKEFISMQRDAFMMIGEVVNIDKKKKMIYLSNNNTVSYNYLIVSCNNKASHSEIEQDKEFSQGLQTLIDALRIKKIHNSSLNNALPTSTLTRTPHYMHSKLLSSKEIKKIVNHHILRETGASFSLSLDGIDKRVYIVA